MTTGVRLVALGDSLSAGVGDSVGPGCAPGWPAHLAAVVGAHAHLNLGRNGARARHMHDEQLEAALAFAPTVATVVVGGNDVLRGDYDPAEVGGWIARATDALQASGSQVVLATLPSIALFGMGPPAVRRVMSRRIDALNDVVTGVARTRRALLFDTGVVIAAAGPTAWHVDRIHPSPFGHRVLALAAADALAALGIAACARPEAPPDPPGPVGRLAWLARHGVPWALRRSVDLLPELVRVVVSEAREPGPGAPGAEVRRAALGLGSGADQGRVRA